VKCAVVGGGFAGLAAAVRLASEGQEVTLLERAATPGGRARSFVDEISGDTVDVGVHIILGGYRATRGLLARIGASGRIDFGADLATGRVDGRVRRFGRPAPARLPSARLHALGPIEALVRCEALTVAERALALRVVAAVLRPSRLASGPEEGDTVDGWLDRLAQPAGSRRALWHPLAVAALNDDPRTASARLFAAVLRDTLCGGPDDARLGLAPSGLSSLYATDAARAVVAKGGAVRCDAEVIELLVEEVDGERAIRGVRLAGGERLDADVVIAAVPPQALLALAPEALRAERGFQAIARLRPSPVVTVHLWLDRPLFDEPLVALIDSPVRWVVSRARDAGQLPEAHALLSLAMPAAHGLVDRDDGDLAELALAELARAFPSAPRARLLHRRVVKERHATIAHPARGELDRPRPRTSTAGLFIAGDFVRTGLPASIESAVRSGEDAALLALGYQPPRPPPPPRGFVPVASLVRRPPRPA
jgi:squalene-associated FAD-dependent desaturase